MKYLKIMYLAICFFGLEAMKYGDPYGKITLKAEHNRLGRVITFVSAVKGAYASSITVNFYLDKQKFEGTALIPIQTTFGILDDYERMHSMIAYCYFQMLKTSFELNVKKEREKLLKRLSL